MTKLISIFIVILLIVAGWKLVAYYQNFEEETRNAKKIEAGADIKPERLEGLPWELNESLQTAQKNGADGLGKWLKAYDAAIKDPRKAWIQMDYCLALVREDPNEARRVFQAVKERVPTNSPVYPRIRQLEQTFK